MDWVVPTPYPGGATNVVLSQLGAMANPTITLEQWSHILSVAAVLLVVTLVYVYLNKSKRL